MNDIYRFDNYIFDLYGTLIDICTNEHKKTLWRQMASFYNVFGCDWSDDALYEAFWHADREERAKIRSEMGIDCPEIRLEVVFARMLLECPSRHGNTSPLSAKNVEDLAESQWTVDCANLFRVLSRSRMRLYDYTEPFLTELRKRGKKIFLLSNAQKIFTMPEIEQTGLNKYFDAMYISSDHYMMKPYKGFMELLLREQALDPDRSVMVGNEMRSDVAVAVKCGMSSIYLNTAGYSIAKIERQERELFADTPYKRPLIVMDPNKELIN